MSVETCHNYLFDLTMTEFNPKRPDVGLARASAIYNLLSGSPAKAWKETLGALKAFPRSERIQFVAGLVLIARGKKSEARPYFANAIKLGTPDPDAYLNLAFLSNEVGKLDFALHTLDLAQERFADELRVLMARIQILQSAGDAARALDVTNETLIIHPKATSVRLLRGILLADNGHLLDGIAALKDLLDDHPDHAIALINLGRFYAFTNQFALGLEVTEYAYGLSPDNSAVVENLAIRKRENGDFEGAAILFRKLATLSPQSACEAFRHLADIVPTSELGDLSKKIDRLGRETRSSESRAQLEFARAALAKRQGDKVKFMQALKGANRRFSKLRPYDGEGASRLQSRIRDQYRDEQATTILSPSLPSVPIFVMGLPRSGTTLLERMLSSAEDVAGLGEISLLNRYFAGQIVAGSTITEGLNGLRASYSEFQKNVGKSKWTIDKMPANYMHMGWINRAFPEGKIVLLRRDPKDIALSLFENYFDDAGQNFTFDEISIAHQMALFEETIREWRYLGASFIELNYEDLVSDPEASLHEVSEYCEIIFDPEMLKPEQNLNSIRTASSVQARREINGDSVSRWKKYPELLPYIFGK